MNSLIRISGVLAAGSLALLAGCATVPSDSGFADIEAVARERLGVLGDWEHPYLTLDKEYEADELRLFADIVEQASQEAQQGKTAARTVGDCMVDIEGGTGETTTMIRSIAVAMDEQQATVAQIEGNVTELKTVALTNSSSAEEIAATMIQLSKQSNLMRQRLAEFSAT